MKGSRAVVSGGAKGIGRAVSEALAIAGARVAVLSRSAEAAREACSSLPSSGAEQQHGTGPASAESNSLAVVAIRAIVSC